MRLFLEGAYRWFFAELVYAVRRTSQTRRVRREESGTEGGRSPAGGRTGHLREQVTCGRTGRASLSAAGPQAQAILCWGRPGHRRVSRAPPASPLRMPAAAPSASPHHPAATTKMAPDPATRLSAAGRRLPRLEALIWKVHSTPFSGPPTHRSPSVPSK